MRELFAFIKAAADLGLYKLKIRLDDLFTDPHLGESDGWPGDDAGVPFTEVENLIELIDHAGRLGCPSDRVAEYIGRALDLDLQTWQLDLIELYCGKQVQA